MALTGVLKADFSDFDRAVTQAQSKLVSFQTDATKVDATLNRMTTSLSGGKLIQDAVLMTEAVAKVGGASTLTAAQMGSVNARVGEAIEKFKALGIEAPAAMTKLHAETTKVSGANQSVLTTLAPLAGAFGIAFSVGSMVNFGKSILADADALVKLSEKTGIAIGPLQGLKFAAEQSGNSFDQVTSAISMMQRRIGDGDDSAVGALRKLGISLSDFKALSPDQQFIAIAREVAKIEDPMQRVKVATELFGRAGADVLPTLISHIDELARKAPAMAEGAVRAFDDIGDAANLLGGHVRTGIGNAFDFAIDQVARLAEGVRHISEGELVRAAAALGDFAERGIAPLPPAIDGTNRSIRDMSLSMGEADRISRELTKATQENITKNEASTKVNDALKRTQDALFGRDHIERANQYVTALGGVENLTKLTDDKKKELKASVDKAIAAYAALGEKAPASLLAIVAATGPAVKTMADLDAEITKLHEKSLPPFAGLLVNVDRTLDALPPSVAAFRSELVFTAETIETQVTPALEEMTAKANAAVMAMGAASRPMGELSVNVGNVNPATGAGKAGTDPKVWNYLQQGYTLGEAVSLASGVPTNIGAAHGYWDATGWHSNTRGGTAGVRGLAVGGNMAGGEKGWVGEQGPELFTPRSAGTISPHGAGGGPTIIVNTVAGDGPAIARLVERALTDAYRSKGGRM